MYRLNTKIRLTMLCFSGFELNSRWVSLIAVLDKMYVEGPALLNSKQDGKYSSLTIARLHP